MRRRGACSHPATLSRPRASRRSLAPLEHHQAGAGPGLAGELGGPLAALVTPADRQAVALQLVDALGLTLLLPLVIYERGVDGLRLLRGVELEGAAIGLVALEGVLVSLHAERGALDRLRGGRLAVALQTNRGP